MFRFRVLREADPENKGGGGAGSEPPTSGTGNSNPPEKLYTEDEVKGLKTALSDHKEKEKDYKAKYEAALREKNAAEKPHEQRVKDIEGELLELKREKSVRATIKRLAGALDPKQFAVDEDEVFDFAMPALKNLPDDEVETYLLRVIDRTKQRVEAPPLHVPKQPNEDEDSRPKKRATEMSAGELKALRKSDPDEYARVREERHDAANPFSRIPGGQMDSPFKTRKAA